MSNREDPGGGIAGAVANYLSAITEARDREDLTAAEAESAAGALALWENDSPAAYLDRIRILLDHYTRVKSRRELAVRIRASIGVRDEDLTETGIADMITKTNWLVFGSGYLERDVKVIRTLRLADLRRGGNDLDRVLEAYRNRPQLFTSVPTTMVMTVAPVRSGDRGGGHRQARRSARRVAVAARGSSRGDPDQSGDDPPGSLVAADTGRGVGSDIGSAFQRALVAALELDAGELDTLADHIRIRLIWLNRWAPGEAA